MNTYAVRCSLFVQNCTIWCETKVTFLGVVFLKVLIINKKWDTNENIQTQHYHGGLDK